MSDEGPRVAAAAQSAGGSGTPGVSEPNLQAGTSLGTPRAPSTAAPLEVPSYPADAANLNDAAGRRVRLRPKPGAVDQVYGNNRGLMRPLIQTTGLLFPYQPTITYQQDVMYSQLEMVHTNQDFQSYVRTPALKLQVEGEFTCQNQQEGLYSLACIHFLRTVTKMWFGGPAGSEAERYQGTPPPVLLFDAYGQYMFNNLPVIVNQFSVSLPKDVDYMPVRVDEAAAESPSAVASFGNIFRPNRNSLQPSTSAGYAWLPVHFTISVQLTVQNTPQRLRAFNMTEFRSGKLVKGGGWV